ncbi:hypothetical protein D3C87_1632030 [compost metagenome]
MLRLNHRMLLPKRPLFASNANLVSCFQLLTFLEFVAVKELLSVVVLNSGLGEKLASERQHIREPIVPR